MKQILKIAILALPLAFLAACSGGGSPEAVVKNFFAAMAEKDYEDAKSYLIPESRGMFDMAVSMMGAVPDEQMAFDVQSVECTEDGDKAKCSVSIKNPESGEAEEQELDLVKQDGEWKIAFNKDK